MKVTKEEMEIIKAILAKHAAGAKIYAFGSRVSGTPKPHSDLDLCIDAGEKLDLSRLSGLKNAFEESDLPYRVDVVDWQAIDEAFRGIVKSTRVEV